MLGAQVIVSTALGVHFDLEIEHQFELLRTKKTFAFHKQRNAIERSFI